MIERSPGIRWIVASILLTLITLLLPGYLPADECHSQVMFTVPLGDDRPETLGTTADLEKVTDLDRFHMPAAFLPFETQGYILVLDSNRRRIVSYTPQGQFIGAIALSWNLEPIDFSWCPKRQEAAIIFQDTAAVALLNFKALSPESGHMEGIQCFNGMSDELFQHVTLASTNGDFSLHFSSSSGTEILMQDMDLAWQMNPGAPTIYLPRESSMLSVVYSADRNPGARATPSLEFYNGFQNERERIPLDGGLTIAPGGEMGCRLIRPIGSDMAGNFVLEALFGPAEDAITRGYAYRYDNNGKFLGRGRIPHCPEMLSNRYIAVDPSGAVWYMRCDNAGKVIEFQRVLPTETD